MIASVNVLALAEELGPNLNVTLDEQDGTADQISKHHTVNDFNTSETPVKPIPA